MNNNINNKIKYSICANRYFSEIIQFINNFYEKNKLKHNIFIETCGDNYVKRNITTNCINILIQGEPNITNEHLYDIIINIPFVLLSLNERRKIHIKYNINFNDKKDCVFMYKMSYKHREDIFKTFIKKIQVDALGASCKNVNIQQTRNIYNSSETYNDIAVEIYSKYKFVLAIENTYKQDYFTEKIINPILANSVPIYFGTDSAFNIINKKRVIYYNDFNNIDNLIDYVINLSKNEAKYNEILRENIFATSEITLENYNNYIEKKIDDLLTTKILKKY